jgi:hypothetical protein
VAKLEHFDMTVRNQNLIHSEIKSRLSSGNAWYHLGQAHFIFLSTAQERKG